MNRHLLPPPGQLQLHQLVFFKSTELHLKDTRQSGIKSSTSYLHSIEVSTFKRKGKRSQTRYNFTTATNQVSIFWIQCVAKCQPEPPSCRHALAIGSFLKHPRLRRNQRLHLVPKIERKENQLVGIPVSIVQGASSR